MKKENLCILSCAFLCWGSMRLREEKPENGASRKGRKRERQIAVEDFFLCLHRNFLVIFPIFFLRRHALMPFTVYDYTIKTVSTFISHSVPQNLHIQLNSKLLFVQNYLLRNESLQFFPLFSFHIFFPHKQTAEGFIGIILHCIIVHDIEMRCQLSMTVKMDNSVF